MPAKIYNQDEIINDIRNVLKEIFERTGGTNFFQIGIVHQLSDLPEKVSKLHVWYIVDLNLLKKILDGLNNVYGLELDIESTGFYLFVHENQEEQS